MSRACSTTWKVPLAAIAGVLLAFGILVALPFGAPWTVHVPERVAYLRTFRNLFLPLLAALLSLRFWSGAPSIGAAVCWGIVLGYIAGLTSYLVGALIGPHGLERLSNSLADFSGLVIVVGFPILALTWVIGALAATLMRGLLVAVRR